MFLRIVEHSGADAILATGALEHVYIDAALASAPESLVVGEVGKRHGMIAQLGVHRHNGSSAREREYLGMRPTGAGEREGEVLDALCHTQSAELRVDDKTRSGDILLVAPCLDVAEPYKLLAVKSNYSLGFLHLRSHIFVCTLSDTGAANLGGFLYGIKYCVDIFLM